MMVTVFLDLIDNEEDRKRFEDIYNQYSNLMMSIALDKLGGNIEDAEECLQESFLSIAKNFDKVKEIEKDKIKKYLITVITGFAISKIRSNSCHHHVVPYDNIDEFINESILDKGISKYNVIEIVDALDRLDECDRLYLYLMYVYGYKSREIAEMFNLTDASVRKKIQFAKRDVVEYLEKDKGKY